MINNIMVNKNVEWSGKVASKFALFELIFNKFILNFKDMGTSCVLYITNRNNDFIENMRIKKKHVLNENEIIKLERNTLVKVILKDNHVYFRGYQFHYDINKKVYFEFVFVFDNIVIFLCDKILYILKNDKDIIIWKERFDNDELDTIFNDCFLKNNFQFEVTEGLIIDLLKDSSNK